MTGTSTGVMGQNGMEWQVTATTLKCEFVGNFATIMVQPDGTAKCAYVNRQGKTKEGKRRLKGCKWPECPLVAEFREKALAM
jgi:hypothetical protein